MAISCYTTLAARSCNAAVGRSSAGVRVQMPLTVTLEGTSQAERKMGSRRSTNMRTSAVPSPQPYATMLSDGCRLPNIASESSELTAALSAAARVVICSVLEGVRAEAVVKHSDRAQERRLEVRRQKDVAVCVAPVR